MSTMYVVRFGVRMSSNVRRVLVLGASGLIGHQVYFRLKSLDQFKVLGQGFTRNLLGELIAVDAREEGVFFDELRKADPDYIINCIGLLIDAAAADPKQAIYLNALFPHQLEQFCNVENAKLIHISTDCVFSGDKLGEPYIETSLRDANSVYGRAKGLGEIISEVHLTLRTSVVGPEISNEGDELFNWFMKQNSRIKGYTGAVWSGVTTEQLARAVEWAIKEDVTGLYHVTNNQKITKYELLNLFKKYTGKDIQIDKVVGTVTDKHFIDTRKLIEFQLPDYDEMIAQMVNGILRRKSLYGHYNLSA